MAEVKLTPKQKKRQERIINDLNYLNVSLSDNINESFENISLALANLS